MTTQEEVDRKNAATSAKEVADFKSNPPQKYFLYISEDRAEATTWTGEKLGTVKFGREWRDNLGGTRQSVTVRGINGKVYFGTYFKSSGNYARIRAMKG